MDKKRYLKEKANYVFSSDTSCVFHFISKFIEHSIVHFGFAKNKNVFYISLSLYETYFVIYENIEKRKKKQKK